jgi:queuine tRNA-ribosyltransferase
MGGLHKMMGWDGPMLTDSGGFQIFSMGHGTIADEIKGRRQDGRDQMLLKVTEDAAIFKSYVDGTKITLTPEYSMQIQRKLGADLIVQLDECTAFHVDKDYTAQSMRMSHRWGDRSLDEFKRTNDGKQAVYGIMQGGIYEDLRQESAEYTRSRDFFGTAIGGSLGGSRAQMVDVVGICMEYAHPDRPVHLLGIGGIQDVFDNIRLGIDTFDCVSPTRIARHGWALLKGAPRERINIRNARFRDDPTPLAEDQDNPASQFARGYVHHLIKSHEPLGAHILSMHNVATISRLMREIRQAIADDTLDALEKEWIAG